MLRILHTADWHLGHSLHSFSREYEHRCFLDWLLDTLEQELADALIIAGDVFDSANPPASAQQLLYHFLAQARQRCPSLDIVMVAGNHDSPARLEAPRSLLAGMGIHVVGTLPGTARGGIDLDRLLVPLTNRDGKVQAWCAALPFLRPADLPAVGDEALDPLVEGVRRVYGRVIASARERLGPGQALVATGHCYMVGTRLSELSERKILGGNQHALPVDIFPEDLSYAALGHLHLAQTVGRQETVRYSGSPIPLSLGEDRYPHQVVRVDLEGGRCLAMTPLPVPRSVAILRLPGNGPGPLKAVMALLRSLDLPTGTPAQTWPFLEIAVHLERPEPGLRRQLDEALAGKAIRLLKISSYYPGTGGALADAIPESHLQELTPDEVFMRRYWQKHGNDPPAELLAAFHALLEDLQGERP